ncbi:MAG: metallophosphoesterase [Parvularculaceae bacterium]|nr:metallophosphoesterase [Parvularculaceae bacterium]
MRLAHLTDLHFPIESPPAVADLLSKRALGYLSWRRKRRFRHVASALGAVLDDCRGQTPDLALITGDVTNIALPAEFEAAARGLRQALDPARTVFTPGNHDTYVAAPWETGLGQLAFLMKGERQGEEGARDARSAGDFPFVRRASGVAVILANSSPPTLPGLASGRLGPEQLRAVRTELLAAKARGEARVLALHHPVTAGAVSRRKALDDATELRALLAETGVELVLHGHMHRSHWDAVATPDGPRPVVGGASASHPAARRDYRPARYNLFTIERDGARWRIDVEVRELDPEARRVETAERRQLL